MSAAPVVAEASRFLRRRGLRSFLRSATQHLNARWWLRGATRVGTVRLRGRAHVENRGRLVFGDRVRLDGRSVRLDFGVGAGGTLEVGEGTFINYGSDISALRSVRIGRRCDIGQYAIIIDSNYHRVDDHLSMDEPQPVIIEDDVWLGARVTVLPGSHIGRGSVIGAHSVVTGVIPPRSLAGGVPARVIRSLNP
jgi:maltose O-acetyltransferase